MSGPRARKIGRNLRTNPIMVLCFGARRFDPTGRDARARWLGRPAHVEGNGRRKRPWPTNRGPPLPTAHPTPETDPVCRPPDAGPPEAWTRARPGILDPTCERAQRKTTRAELESRPRRFALAARWHAGIVRPDPIPYDAILIENSIALARVVHGGNMCGCFRSHREHGAVPHKCN